MFDPKYSSKGICLKWKVPHIFSEYNFLDSEAGKPGRVEAEQFKRYLKDNCQSKRVVITAGHFIPNPEDYDEVPKNPIRAWNLACQTVRYLKENGIESKISLILNDAYLKPEARKIIFDNYVNRLPAPYSLIMKENGLGSEDILPCRFNGDLVFSEKKLSNRTTYLIRRKKSLERAFGTNSHCVNGLISYLIDLSQNSDINVSVIIFPSCSWLTTKDSIDLYLKLDNKLRHICYFYTPNCLY